MSTEKMDTNSQTKANLITEVTQPIDMFLSRNNT